MGQSRCSEYGEVKVQGFEMMEVRSTAGKDINEREKNEEEGLDNIT